MWSPSRTAENWTDTGIGLTRYRPQEPSTRRTGGLVVVTLCSAQQSSSNSSCSSSRRGQHVAAAVRAWLPRQDGTHVLPLCGQYANRQLSVSCHFGLMLAPFAHESVMKASTLPRKAHHLPHTGRSPPAHTARRGRFLFSCGSQILSLAHDIVIMCLSRTVRQSYNQRDGQSGRALGVQVFSPLFLNTLSAPDVHRASSVVVGLRTLHGRKICRTTRGPIQTAIWTKCSTQFCCGWVFDWRIMREDPNCAECGSVYPRSSRTSLKSSSLPPGGCVGEAQDLFSRAFTAARGRKADFLGTTEEALPVEPEDRETQPRAGTITHQSRHRV